MNMHYGFSYLYRISSALFELESDKAALQSAQAALDRARTNLNYVTIRSPIDDVILQRSVEAGQQVRFIVSAYPDREFNGTVTQIRRKPSTIQNVVNYIEALRYE